MQKRFWWIVGLASVVLTASLYIQKVSIGGKQSTTPDPTLAPTIATEDITPTEAPTLTKQTVQKKISPPKGTSMATKGEIFVAINSYRNAHGLSSVASDGTLCSIAQSRANQQSSNGRLNHDGFDALAHSQTTFHHVAEVLQWFSQPQTAQYLVDVGWDGSPSHKATILDGSWTHGCAGVSGLFSVFVFGRP